MKKTTLIFALALGFAGASIAVTPVTLPSGVVVQQLKPANGPFPTANSTVTVHYRGTLVSNGQEFDSSYKRGQPASFPLKAVIPCWTEGVQHIPVGGKAALTCPSNTAYGARALPGIPANSDLRFEVEVLSSQ